MSSDLVLIGSYDYRVVALSIVIAVLGSYAALDLGERVTAARNGARLLWLIGGATAMGIGIWSMHYTAMLAFHLPVPMWHDWPTTLVSLLTAMFASVVGLFVASRRQMGWQRATIGSIFMGGSIVGLHYIAMASMRLPAMIHYSPPLVLLSVLLAIVFSLMALWLTFLFRNEVRGWRKAASALLMAAAISGMHYTAMAAASFTPSAAAPDLSHAVSISFLGTVGITIVTLMVLVVALLTSLADRLQEQRALLDELFEQAPEAIALMNMDDRVVRVNREFTRLFGYTPQETLGRRLTELIVPDDLQAEEQQYTDLVAKGQRVDVEGVRQRKDGSRLQVSMLRVPVSVPGGQVAVYGIYRDITERKRAEAMLQTFSQRLIETQEAERRRVARALHDEIGQALTTLKLNLQLIQHAAQAWPQAEQLNESIGSIDRAVQQVRELSLDLRPSLLDDLGLVAALRWYVDREAQRAGLLAEVVSGPFDTRLPPELETACFRIVQEALTNVVRHGQARQVWVELRQRGAQLHLTIHDDGIGFDVQTVLNRRVPEVNLGLQGMQERALIVGGQLTINSTLGHGTEVKAHFHLTSPRPLGRELRELEE
jgi:PAS domain S-box-containing protein